MTSPFLVIFQTYSIYELKKRIYCYKGRKHLDEMKLIIMVEKIDIFDVQIAKTENIIWQS